MSDSLVPGDRVKHPTLHETWGPGEVLDVAGGKITVFFALAGQKTLKGISLVKLSGSEASHPLLDNRRRSGKSTPRIRPFAELKAAFLRLFPGGFSDPEYIRTERDYKVKAHDTLKRELAREAIEPLLAAGEYVAICKRVMKVVGATNLIYANEIMDLSDGIKDAAGAKAFAEAVYGVLYAETTFRARFEALCEALAVIGAEKWPIVTYLPFLAFPNEHMLIKPAVIKLAAAACDFELNYDPTLNWDTYESTLRFADTLRGLIADLEPRDMIDVQSFIWCIGERVNG